MQAKWVTIKDRFRGQWKQGDDDLGRIMKLCLQCERPFAADDWRCPQCGNAPDYHDGVPVFADPKGGDGFRPELFAELSRLEGGHFWFRSRNRLIEWVLQKYVPALQDFLEIGCGTGFVLSGIMRAFPHLRLTGSEYFGEGLRFAAGRLPHASFCQMDARRLPFVEEFSAIGAFDVLEHIDEDELVLRQCFRALRPGGGLVITVPQHRWLWSATDDYACHVRRYERRELEEKMLRAGFRVELATSFVSLLLPAMVLSRRDGGKTAESEGRLAELRLPAPLNLLFSVVMTIERWLIRCGIRFPVGGSLLMVGRKRETGET